METEDNKQNKQLKELSDEELQKVNGGSATPSPGVLGTVIGMIQEFEQYQNCPGKDPEC